MNYLLSCKVDYYSQICVALHLGKTAVAFNEKLLFEGDLFPSPGNVFSSALVVPVFHITSEASL